MATAAPRKTSFEKKNLYGQLFKFKYRKEKLSSCVHSFHKTYNLIVSFAAVIRVVTQRSSPLTAAHARATSLSFKLINKEAGFHVLETWS